MIQILKSLPDKWAYCLTALLLPLSVSFSFKLFFTDLVFFKRGDTEIKLSQVKQEALVGDRLTSELIESNRKLIEASEKAQIAAKKRKVKLPELNEIEQAAIESQKVTEDLKENNEVLQELISEQPSSEPPVEQSQP